MRQRSLPTAAVVGAITALALGLRLFHLTYQNLWFDEIESVRVVSIPMGHLARQVMSAEGVPPTAWLSIFYYATLKIFALVPHVSLEWTLRLWSALLGAATVPALAWTARQLVPKRVALTAATLLAVSPFHVWYSQEIRPYALLVLLDTLAVGFYLRALDRNRFGAWCGFAVCALLALYTHPIAVTLLLVSLVAFVLSDDIHRARAWRSVVVACAAIAALYLPAAMLVRSNGANVPADTRPVTLFDTPYALYTYSIGFSLGPSTGELHERGVNALAPHVPMIGMVAIAFGTFLLAGLAYVGRLPRTSRALLFTWLVLPLLFTFAAAAATANPFNVRYTIVSYPAFVIVVSAGLWRLLGAQPSGDAPRLPLSPLRFGRPAVGLLALTLLALTAWSLRNLYVDPRYAKEASRDLATVLSSDATCDDVVLVNAPYMASALRYYYTGPAQVLGYAPPDSTDAAGMIADLTALTAGHTHVWLVLTRAFHGDRTGVLHGLLGKQLVQDREHRFPGIVAYRFSRYSPTPPTLDHPNS